MCINIIPKSHSPPSIVACKFPLKNVIARMEVEVFKVNIYWGLGELPLRFWKL